MLTDFHYNHVYGFDYFPRYDSLMTMSTAEPNRDPQRPTEPGEPHIMPQNPQSPTGPHTW